MGTSIRLGTWVTCACLLAALAGCTSTPPTAHPQQRTSAAASQRVPQSTPTAAPPSPSIEQLNQRCAATVATTVASGRVASPPPPLPTQQPYFLEGYGESPTLVATLTGGVIATLPSSCGGFVFVRPSGPDIVVCVPPSVGCYIYSHTGQLLAKGVPRGSARYDYGPSISPSGQRWVYVKEQGDNNVPLLHPTTSQIYVGGFGMHDRLVATATEPPGDGLELLGWADDNNVWASANYLYCGCGAGLYPAQPPLGLYRISISADSVTQFSPPSSQCNAAPEIEDGVVLLICAPRSHAGGTGTVTAYAPSGALGGVTVSPIRGGYGDGILAPSRSQLLIFSAERPTSPPATTLAAPFPNGRLENFGPPGFMPVAFLADGSLLMQNSAPPIAGESSYVFMKRIFPGGRTTSLPITAQGQLFFA